MLRKPLVVLPVVLVVLGLEIWYMHERSRSRNAEALAASTPPAMLAGNTGPAARIEPPPAPVFKAPLPASPPLVSQPDPPPAAPPPAPGNWQSLPGAERLANLIQRRTADVSESLRGHGFSLGEPVFVRILKESSELELWIQAEGSTGYRLYKTFAIARWSGDLGPKLKEGDGQAPEGFYNVTKGLMNPQSSYHLAFNIGYPNPFDRALNRTGGLIMVHGKDVSIGCYAMTDPGIEEIYLIVHSALSAGQPAMAVHCFPFRMTGQRMADAQGPWLDFWQNLKQGWDRFEKTHVPPEWTVSDGRYVFP